MTESDHDAPASSYPNLFAPFELAGLRLRNRIVHASMTTRFIRDGRLSEAFVAYHVNRAAGGAAMTITEPMNMLAGQFDPTRPDVRPGRNEADLVRLAGAVDAQGCRLLGQVQHSGRGRREQGRNTRAVGVSPLPDGLSWTVPHALSTGEVEAMILDFARSAAWLQACGFSGVEISAGHGHLFHQFLSPQANIRTDRFGGDLQARCRMLCELIAAIRAECGAGFIVGTKLPGEDGVAGGIDLELATRITGHLAASAPPDYLTWCWGAHDDTLDWHLPDAHGERHPYLESIARLRQAAAGIPAAALGYITDPNEAERALAGGSAELVMLGRPLVTDPAWPRKAAEGREAQIRYCVSCNSCWGAIIAGEAIQCDNNPRVGAVDEADWWPTAIAPAGRRRIVVVGSGVAGMEAAWVAAARGHEVTLFGAGSEPGGSTRLHAGLPGGENLSSIYDYQWLSAARAGVRLELNHRASADDVLGLAPDAVILATGSYIRWPAFLPAGLRDEALFPDVRAVAAMLATRPPRAQGTAVLYDHDHTAMTYAVAERLSACFERVVIITPRERIAADVALVNRQGIYRRLYRRGVEIITSAEPLGSSAFEEAEVAWTNVFNASTGVIEDVALLTYANSRVPRDELVAPLQAAGVALRLIGDCWAPRFVMDATREGYEAGMGL